MIGFIGTSTTIILNYNHLQQLTPNECLRLAPFPPGLRVSSNVTDLVMIYESVTFSASVICWLTLHSWTLNSLTNDWLRNELVDDSSTTESINYLSSFYKSGRTDERPLPPTVRALVCFIRCHKNVLTEPLSSNGIFRVYSLLCKRVLIP
jgi:hypothetical protein